MGFSKWDSVKILPTKQMRNLVISAEKSGQRNP